VTHTDTLALKKRLRCAWTPFFSRFGTLLPSQLAAIPHILAREDVFLSAATASGKTEALVAPLAELVASDSGKNVSVVYVAPTRALVNDVEKRCRAPLEEMGISCRVRTGERREFKEHAPSRFMITTPESRDSTLTRRPDLFRSLSAIVLDELHLVDKTYRGDQLRLVIRRLASVVDRLQVCGASATLEKAESMARRYSGAPVMIDVAGSREVRERYFDSIGAVCHVLVQEARSLRKILCFANSRKAVEQGAVLLKEALPNWPVMVHHGSLHRREREDTEAALRETARWMCVATTTLEVGIDVNDVDAVLLLEPPWSVAALLQRIGRANRRAGTVNVLALSGTPEQRLIYEEQFRRARLGLLDQSKYQLDLAVIVQQFFAMLSGAPGGLADAPLRSLFSDFASEAEISAILDHLETAGHVQLRRGQWFASTDVMDLAAQGNVYSNVPDSSLKVVIDQSTGQRVGEVSDAVDSVFVLAGRAWWVTRFTHNEIYVQPTSAAGGLALFQFHGAQGAFARYLPPTLRSVKGYE